MKDGRIRVLMMVPNLRVSSGVTNFAMNYYRNVDHGKVLIDFVTLSFVDSPYIDEVRSNGSEVFFLGPLLEHPVKHIKLAKKIIAEHDYDIIHDNIILKSLPIMKYAKKKIPVRILHSHAINLGETGLKEKINRLLLPMLIKKANCYTACSSVAGKAMFGDKDFTVIPNIIDTDDYVFDEAKREQVRADEKVAKKYVVATVGRLAEAKNPIFAVNVMEEVLKRRDDIEYWWIGSGPIDEQTKNCIEEKGLSDRIRMLGSRDDLKDLYHAMDVFFLPSKGEGFGLACIEAEASGLPCVVSDKFPPEVNITGDVQFIPLEEDINKWADAIIASLEKNIDRSNGNKILRESRYSRAGSGSMLTDFYEEQIKAGKKD
ncbi:MAG: glycosyltransferase [Saccharofermentans sp.]|nr:glycosyltransferase [Saccharofermentans sp.]